VDHHIYADQEALMPHRNAPLTETGRLRLARCVVEDGWPLRRAAERFQVTQRRATLDPWLHMYNHHRGHTALKGLPPASRVTNLSGQNN
jgi:transposase InsO family protein